MSNRCLPTATICRLRWIALDNCGSSLELTSLATVPQTKGSAVTMRINFTNYGTDFINYENRHAYILGSVTPRWPWYLPPRSLYEVSQISSDSKKMTCATPSFA